MPDIHAKYAAHQQVLSPKSLIDSFALRFLAAGYSTRPECLYSGMMTSTTPQSKRCNGVTYPVALLGLKRAV
jgi:hypothetical protein